MWIFIVTFKIQWIDDEKKCTESFEGSSSVFEFITNSASKKIV